MSVNQLSPGAMRRELDCSLSTPVQHTGLLALVLAFLDEVETWIHRMLVGIYHFLTSTMPLWAVRQLFDLGRVAVKAIRVVAVFTFWLALTCWPLLLLSAGGGWFWKLLLLSWTALTLTGSVWGARHVQRRRAWRSRTETVPPFVCGSAAAQRCR